MNEWLLQYIWQQSLYSSSELRDTDGNAITVQHPGIWNRHEGPDFSEARIKVGDLSLIGNVEIHINESDWLRHRHQDNKHYQNIILHVVLNADLEVQLGKFTTLELGPHISQTTLTQYQDLVDSPMYIPCTPQLPEVRDIVWEAWLERMLAERWEEKTEDWKLTLANSQNDWRSLAYLKLASSFGFKVNAAAMEALAQAIPLNIISKHANNLASIEALLFGASGLLPSKSKEEYPQTLQSDYDFLQTKHQLAQQLHLPWKMLRMRPANFPTLRLAQFCALLQQAQDLLAAILGITNIVQATKLLDAAASGYWDTHYTFKNKLETKQTKHLGSQAIENIVINTIAPFQYLYGKLNDMPELIHKSYQLISSISAERNNITKEWRRVGRTAINAAQSQAQIQLYNNYCSAKRCLECSIGNTILRKTAH